jgi:hypothetical protein
MVGGARGGSKGGSRAAGAGSRAENSSDDGHASVGAVAFPIAGASEPGDRHSGASEPGGRVPRAEHEPTVPNWLSRDEISVWPLCVWPKPVLRYRECVRRRLAGIAHPHPR